MKLGSPQHKQQFYQDLIKTYHENIWKDEIYLIQLEEAKGNKRKQIAEIDLTLEDKKFKGKNEGDKAKFVAEQELVHLDNEIAEVRGKKDLWLARIEQVKRIAEEN